MSIFQQADITKDVHNTQSPDFSIPPPTRLTEVAAISTLPPPAPGKPVQSLIQSEIACGTEYAAPHNQSSGNDAGD